MSKTTLDTPFTSGKLGKMSGGGSAKTAKKAPAKMKSGKC